MYFSIFLASLGFIAFFIWYLAAESAASRRLAGLGAIIASLLACGLALYPLSQTIRLGIDLRGGTEFLLEVQGNPTAQALDQAANVIRKRLDATGMREISILPEGSFRLRILIPGLQGVERKNVETTLSQVAKLEFQLVPANATEILQAAQQNGGKLPFEYSGQYQILPQVEKDINGKDVTTQQVVETKVQMSGKHVTHAYRSIETMGDAVVNLEFDSDGAKQFGDLTSANVNRQLAIVLDHVVRSSPVIRSAMTNGFCQISGGNMSPIECEELASVLQNPLENPIHILDERSVDATLGSDSIQSGLRAGLIALVLVIGFMVLYYRISGFIAVLALAVNLVLLFGLLAQFHFTLTLPGIAGIVLTIGMAVDANVTTLIPAVVLAYLGTGPLRGFAVTLVLGIIANLFAALVVSRNAFDWILSINERPNLSMMQFIKSPHFDFLRRRGLGLCFSLIILVAGAITVEMRGTSLLGVDFRGGDAITLTYTQTLPEVGQMRDVLIKAGFKDVTLQPATLSRALLIQTEEQQGEKAADVLTQSFPQAGFSAGSVDKIGAQVGDEMKHKALLALLAGLLGILVYAAIRFEWSYALAAAVGQLHDVLIALSIMALLGRELTLPLVGALLTIAGYSINDKIVVFDRIREGARLREKGSFYEVINRSLNLTLARTIITGFTCLLATAALIVFGGPVIHDFSLAMFIGICSGIYSSHFISPGLAWWLGRGNDRPPAPMTPAGAGVRTPAVVEV